MQYCPMRLESARRASAASGDRVAALVQRLFGFRRQKITVLTEKRLKHAPVRRFDELHHQFVERDLIHNRISLFARVSAWARSGDVPHLLLSQIVSMIGIKVR
jgi:hypothetical protein